jgi:hypothetical protein
MDVFDIEIGFFRVKLVFLGVKLAILNDKKCHFYNKKKKITYGRHGYFRYFGIAAVHN